MFQCSFFLGLWASLSFIILPVDSAYRDCVLPEVPEHGHHEPYTEDCSANRANTPECRGVPGTRVPDGWFLFVHCDPGFVLDSMEPGPSQSTCADGAWLPTLPSCVYSLAMDSHKCVAPPYPANGQYKPLPIECALSPYQQSEAETLVTPGAFLPSACVLLFTCNSGYRLADNDVITICDKNQWHPPSVKCSYDGTYSNSTAVTTEVKIPLSSKEPTNPTKRGGCVLPQAENRMFCSFECKQCINDFNVNHQCAYFPGTAAPVSVVRVQCQQGYRLSDDKDYAAIACVNGDWINEFPHCLKLCPALDSDSVIIQCIFGQKQVDCSKPMLPTTIVKYQCRPVSHSEYPDLQNAGFYKRVITCKSDGKWSNNLPECEPVCGVSKGGIKVSPTIKDGKDTPLGAFPWHAGIYNPKNRPGQREEDWECICGGSLITNRVILTAAHCVANSVGNPRNLRVALGKFYRSWKYEEHYAVKRNVNAIQVPQPYNGAVTSYSWDIALIQLESKVLFNSFIMPVCRDINQGLTVNSYSTAYVVGWGKTMQNGKESEILLHNDLSVLDYKLCSSKLPKVIAFDKFCGEKGSASVAEQGDSGGGVTMVHNDLHFIIGIVSVKINNLSVFTNVSWNINKNWIDEELTKLDYLL